MAAGAVDDANPDDAQTMFSRLFLSCFHKRPSSSPPSSKQKHDQSSTESSLRSEGASTETDSGDSSKDHHQSAAAANQRHTSSPPQPPRPTPKEPPPQPTAAAAAATSKRGIMPKARNTRSAAKAAAAAGSPASEPYTKPDKAASKAKAKSKSKSKYLSIPEVQNGAGAGRASNRAQNAEKLNEIFNGLVTDDDREGDSDGNTLSAQSVIGYIESLGADPNTYESLLVHDILQAEELYRITRKEFVEGWQRVNENHSEVTPDHAAHKKFVKQSSDKLGKDQEAFKKLYQYAFNAGTESVDGKRQKSMGMGTALGCWEALFHPQIGHAWKSPSVNWLEVWQQFLTDKFLVDGKFTRTVSKDLWNQTLVFANKTLEDETLGFWNEDQAWPGIIDDFAAWCKEKEIVTVVEKKEGDEGMEIDD
ncbi:Cullin binding-domain-containing protein [Cladorrhinum sp. PSN259]|nr:Cullin binding-domain-containing protein [Cladorrhinum sp. PSN259]